MPLKIGLIGSGCNADYHLSAYVRSPLVNTVALAEAPSPAREQLVRRWGIIKTVHEDYHALLSDPEVDLVDICTFAGQEQLAREALEAGKHILCAGPPARSCEAFEELLNLAQANQRRFFCLLHQRLIPAHVRVFELLNAQAIGRPFFASITNLSHDSKQPSWTLQNAQYHAIDLLQSFLGPAANVSATAQYLTQEDDDAPDTVCLTLEHPGPALSQITIISAATGDRPMTERRLTGTEGSLLIRDNPEDELPLVGLQGDDFFVLKVKNPPDVQEYATQETIEHFLDCLVNNKAEVITVQQAKAALAATLAAQEAARTGCRAPIVPATA